ncbi:MAG: hypothetical protein DCC67_13495 [Planctomycetota bacterium]|nr:MAG: hypothetical protein DCC67_13495 [Planctomycetota bacterium]
MAGYAGRWIDSLILRLVDLMLAFPGILLTLAVVAVLGTGVRNIQVAVGISLIPPFVRLVRGWPALRQRLAGQLVSCAELRDMLREAGAADAPEQIGVTGERLRRSYRQAYHIRRRFTVLDVARRTGLLDPSLERIFSEGGPFA